MKSFDKFAQAIAAAQTVHKLNQLDLDIVQDRTLLPMELYHLGRLAGMRRLAAKAKTTKAKKS